METVDAPVCNIGPGETRKRRLLGFVALAAGIGLAFVLLATGAPRWWRLIIFFPFWIANLGMLQARARVCIALAAQEVRRMDTATERVTGRDENEQLQKKAKKINRQALITAAVMTLVVMLFPAKLG